MGKASPLKKKKKKKKSMPHAPKEAYQPLPDAKVSDLPGPKYWRSIAPGLHVGDADFLSTAQPIELASDVAARCRAQLLKDGFFTLPPEALPWAPSLQAMRIGVRRLLKRGWVHATRSEEMMPCSDFCCPSC